MPFATRERIWEELPPLDGTPEVKVEKKEVHEDKDGVDTVKVVEVRTERVRKLKCVEERKTWKLFGLTKEDIAANDGMSESEEAVWEYPITEKQRETAQTDKKEYDDVKCRYCGGDHFSHQCPLKDVKAAESSSEEAAKPIERTVSSGGSSDKYSVHQLRHAGAGGSRSEGYRVRVSNLSETATKKDVENLFGAVGEVPLVYLKPKYGINNSGFALLTYETEKAALNACEKLNRHPYDHLVLIVEMATPKPKN